MHVVRLPRRVRATLLASVVLAACAPDDRPMDLPTTAAGTLPGPGGGTTDSRTPTGDGGPESGGNATATADADADAGGTANPDSDGQDDTEPPDFSNCTWAAHQTGDSNHPLAPSSYELFVPPNYDPATPIPLVIGLHGTTGTGQQYLGPYCQWRATAEANGYIIAAPNAWNVNSWFLYSCCTDTCADFCQDDGEEDFMLAMIEEIRHCYNVDPARIYMYGFSQGGFFSSWFCLKHEETMAACGVQGAGCYSPGEDGHCNRRSMGDQARQVPFYLYTGTADQYNPDATDFAGLLSGHGYAFEFENPSGWPHECQASASQSQWDWWAAQGPL